MEHPVIPFLLLPQGRQIQQAIRQKQVIATTRPTRIRVVDLVAIAVEDAEPGLLPFEEMVQSSTGNGGRVFEVVFHGLHLFVRRGVVFIVEHGAVGGIPRNRPAQALLVGRDLLHRRTGDEHKGGLARVQVFHVRRDLIAEEAAVFASLLPLGGEHEVVDDELAAAVEEVAERQGTVRTGELVVLIDFHHGQFTALLHQFVGLPGEFFFFGQKVQSGLTPFVVASNLDGIRGLEGVSLQFRESVLHTLPTIVSDVIVCLW